MLSGKVKEWICTSGFSLEMEAANAFRAAGFDVTQSAIYSDPQTAKGREIDVLARDPDFVGIITISFVLECKSSTKPWVVLLPENGSVLYNRLLTFGVTDRKSVV